MAAISGLERRKEPEKVRAALIDAASRLIAENGLSRLTVDAVARLAGVTKGGLFHHFPTKCGLIAGVLDMMIAMADETVEAAMAEDPEPHGRFSRAYLQGVLSNQTRDADPSGRTLCLAMLGDPTLQECWSTWVTGRVAKHADTDDNINCALARLAADGIWLNSLRHRDYPRSLAPDLLTTLLSLTRPGP